MGKIAELLGTGVSLAVEATAAARESRSRSRGEASNQHDDPTRQRGKARRSPFPVAGHDALGEERSDLRHNSPFPAMRGPFDIQQRKSEELIASPWQSHVDESPPAYRNSMNAVRAGQNQPSSHYQLESVYQEPGRDMQQQLLDQQIMAHGPLPLPVIIPQRRPTEQARGWLLCYAPMLEACGVDQSTFLKFLMDYNKSSATSPFFDAVNIAAFGIGFVPGVAPMVVSMVVPVAVNAAKGASQCRKTATFLDRANQDLFQPLGLLALVFTYDSNSSQQIVHVNVHNADAQDQHSSSDPRGSNMARQNEIFGGPTQTVAKLPPSAPLILPSADEIPNQTENAWSKRANFVADYMDRRGRAKYIQKNGEDGLQVSDVTFRSAWADPRSAAYSGSLKALISGGLLADRDTRKPARDWRREDRVDAKHDNSEQGSSLLGSVKSHFMQRNLLYLMIVNDSE